MGAASPRMSSWERELVPSVVPWVQAQGSFISVSAQPVGLFHSGTIQVPQDCTVTCSRDLQPQNSDTLWGDLVHSMDILRSQV